MHRENIVFWCPSKELELVMKEVTQIVNFINTRSLDSTVVARCVGILAPTICTYFIILRSGGCHE